MAVELRLPYTNSRSGTGTAACKRVAGDMVNKDAEEQPNQPAAKRPKSEAGTTAKQGVDEMVVQVETMGRCWESSSISETISFDYEQAVARLKEKAEVIIMKPDSGKNVKQQAHPVSNQDKEANWNPDASEKEIQLLEVREAAKLKQLELLRSKANKNKIYQFKPLLSPLGEKAEVSRVEGEP